MATYCNNDRKDSKCSRCGNLLENPSFETGLSAWVTNGIQIDGQGPLEGTVRAIMGPNSSMFQDVRLESTCRRPLLLSFQLYPFIIQGNIPTVGDLIVEVLWLDENEDVIGTGLRALIPAITTSNGENILTFIEITDIPPVNAVKARFQFSLGSRPNNQFNFLTVENVIVAPIDSTNLVENSGFQLGLTSWMPIINASSSFSQPVYEGTGRVLLSTGAILGQDISIEKSPRNSSFLFSFAVLGDANRGNLRAQVLWLNKNGAIIGTGLDLFINAEALDDQGNYTTYVDVTSPAPNNAVTAQIRFLAIDNPSTFRIDKVIFARVRSSNLIINSSFENAINPWVAGGTTIITDIEAYEGNHYAELDLSGGFIFQNVPVTPQGCYILNFAYQTHSIFNEGNFLAEVYWLDRNGSEIGLGASIIVLEDGPNITNSWQTYLGVTEPAPPNTVQARVQFSKSRSADVGTAVIDIDKVVFSRLV